FPGDLRGAVRAALGPFADAVVYANGQEAIADASGEDRGVLLAVVEDGDGRRIPALQAVPEDARPLLAELRPDPRVVPLVRDLLSGIYLVADLAEAAERHRAHPAARFVTPDGAVVGPAFVLTPHGRNTRQDEILREAGAIEREMATVRRGIRETRQERDEITKRAAELRSRLEETDQSITKAAERMAGVEADLSAAHREDQLVRDRIAAVEAMAAAAREQLASHAPTLPSPQLPPLPEPPVRMHVEVEALRRERSRLEAAVDRIGREVAELGAEDPIAMRDEVRRLEKERAAAEQALQTAEEAVIQAASVHRATSQRARELLDRHAEVSRKWREQATLVERMREQHEGEDRTRADLERRIRDGEQLLQQGHGVDPDAVVATLEETDSVEELQRQAETVARRMGFLGRVNLLAVGELESVQQRHDFMVRELEDVKAARRDLQAVIKEVDEKMAELFVSAFEDVSREFVKLFSVLFPGGEGRLVLTDPDDPLGSGIEVEARPGRKRVKRLSLLSGGERSLSALAFLFAIFTARPSPFYLMDEVEAALDDVNLHRFLEVVAGFAATSQILIVTHQKRTMEMADVLYGVSMGPEGASTVISQRLVEVAAG
ncbi:MAG TPA: hypothetical protein VJ144_04190, partial [Candidatus Polarisedimenticolia bacterium]|nr:hypothetical protein [Candidatus Polarisedimenticolia bacterium]